MREIDKIIKRGIPIFNREQAVYCRSTSELLNRQKAVVQHWYDEQYDTLEQMMVECEIPEKTRTLILDKSPKQKIRVGVRKNLVRNLIPRKDLEEYSFREIEMVQTKLSDQCFEDERYLFGRLLKELSSKNRLTDIKVVNKKKERVNDVMSLEDYINLAILVFNPKYTPELIKKTMTNKQMANRWLIIATLFLCAYRKSDLRNIPCVGIIGDPDELENTLKKGELSKEEAEKYVILLEAKYDYIGYKPHKTRRNNPDNLRFIVPNEYRQIYGTILAINALHMFHNPEEDFIAKKLSFSYRDLIDLFGEGVKKLNGGVPKYLSTRSLNKRYMQEMANISEAAYDSKMYYLIPGIARSHKTDIGNMAASTWYYLDCKMDDLNTDDILLEIMKRDIGSAQLIKVLETGCGEAYKELDVKTQTEAILQLRAVADAYDVERIGQLAITLQNQIEEDEKHLVELITKDEKQAMFFVRKMVSGIASGSASGKECHTFCTRMACGYSCKYPERDSCLGCGHEVYTRQFFGQLTQRIADINERTKNCSLAIKKRGETIIKKDYYPALLLLLKAIKENDGPVDTYISIINKKKTSDEEAKIIAE